MADSTQQKQRRGPGRPFQPGQSGNPAGKTPGTRHAVTLLAERLMAADVEEIVGTVVSAARSGDMAAAKIVIDRLVPIRKGAPVTFDMPAIDTAEAVDQALGSVAKLMAAGDLSPDEATTVAGVIELRRRAIETNQTERRLAEIEARLDARGKR